jgi:hypothetical protein
MPFTNIVKIEVLNLVDGIPATPTFAPPGRRS